MNRGKYWNPKVGAILVGTAVGIFYVAAAGYGQHGMQQKVEEGKQPAESLDMIHSTQLPAAPQRVPVQPRRTPTAPQQHRH